MKAQTIDNPKEAPPVQRDLPRSARRAVVAMYAGLTLTVLAMLALVYDLVLTGGLARHLHQVYDGYVASPPSEAAIAAYLFTVGALGVVGWLWTVRAVHRRNRWVRPVATALFMFGSGLAVAHLTVAEYGQTILPTSFGLASLLPSLAGLVAVVLLWQGRES